MTLAFTNLNELAQRLARLEEQFASLSEAAPPPAFYSVIEFALRVQRAPYTVREWCRLGRIQATRCTTRCGPYQAWIISHEELLRYQLDGLLPSSNDAEGRDA